MIENAFVCGLCSEGGTMGMIDIRQRNMVYNLGKVQVFIFFFQLQVKTQPSQFLATAQEKQPVILQSEAFPQRRLGNRRMRIAGSIFQI